MASDADNSFLIEQFLKTAYGTDELTRSLMAGADLKQVAEMLIRAGILTPTQLALRAMNSVDINIDAESFGLKPEQVHELYQAALKTLSKDQLLNLQSVNVKPRPKGGLDPTAPDYEFRRQEIERVPIATPKILAQFTKTALNPFIPLGPVKAIDHRQCLGIARDQGGDGTCSVFGTTAIIEALEFLRDRRRGLIDLSEEYCWWVAKGGQTVSGAFGDTVHMLNGYVYNGGCEEWLLPYKDGRILNNWAHIPIDEEAVDRAHLYKQGTLIRLNNGNLDDLKTVLRSGRCVAIDCDSSAFDPYHGFFNSAQGGNSGHIVAIIGYIERPDFNPSWGGGLLIVRNSWGTQMVNGISYNYLGAEYSGHLLLPYTWYQQHTSNACTVHDLGENDNFGAMTEWSAEYYANPSLSGIPIYVSTIGYQLNFDLQGKSPAPGVPAANFSARFTQLQRYRPGWYVFTLTGDDGVRLWVDDRLVINAWKEQGPTAYSKMHYLHGGDHVFRVEYYQQAGGATLKLDINPIKFHYELFDNPDLQGNPIATFDDTSTDLEWRHVAPVGNSGQFSLRATCSGMTFPLRRYQFHTRNTGGCRIWAGSVLVLDDWNGNTPDGNVISLNGTFDLRVEFRHTGIYQALSSGTYYRAALAFDWSEDDWLYELYSDPKHRDIANNGGPGGYPNIDSRYEGFHTQALSGSPLSQVRLQKQTGVPNQYSASDGLPLLLKFDNASQFNAGLPAGITVPDRYWSAFLQRRIFVREAGRYYFYLHAVGGFRLVVDGKEIIRDRECYGDDEFTVTIDLAEGVHDIAIELTANIWGMLLTLRMDRPKWHAQYYKFNDLSNCIADVQLPLEQVISSCPQVLKGMSYTILLSPDENFWAPIGRYRLATRIFGDIRIKYDGDIIVDTRQRDYLIQEKPLIEHKGGRLPLEIEFTYSTKTNWIPPAVLELDLHAAGFIGEFYRGQSLENTQPVEPTNIPPVGYQFDPAIYFNWEQSGIQPRIGPSNWSARWYGQVELPVGRYSVEVTVDDGIRLFIDGRLFYNSWEIEAPTTFTKLVDLVGRMHTVRIEYFQAGGGSRLQLVFNRIPQSPYVPIN